MAAVYRIRKQLRRLIRNEKGAALVEYGMLVGLIALVCITAVENFGLKVADLFEAIVDGLDAVLGDVGDG